MSTVLDSWRARMLQVKVYERCDTCDTLKEGVSVREYWTPTGRVTHTCCQDCGKTLSRQYYGNQMM
jgi:hypothetical protein